MLRPPAARQRRHRVGSLLRARPADQQRRSFGGQELLGRTEGQARGEAGRFQCAQPHPVQRRQQLGQLREPDQPDGDEPAVRRERQPGPEQRLREHQRGGSSADSPARHPVDVLDRASRRPRGAGALGERRPLFSSGGILGDGASPRGRGLAQAQGGREGGEGARSALDAGDEVPGRGLPHLEQRLGHGREGRAGEGGEGLVVEAHEGDVPRHLEPVVVEGEVGPEGHLVAAREDRGAFATRR